MRNKSSGTALLSALMMVVIISSVLTMWIYQTQFHIKKTHIEIENQQAQWIANGAKSWGALLLKQYRFKKTEPILATLSGKSIDIPKNWKMTAKLIDAQSFYNLNNLQENQQRIGFFLLLQHVLKNKKNVNLENIYYGSIAKVDAGFHRKLNQTQKNINRLKESSLEKFSTLGEWQEINGVNEQILKHMRPYLTVLPESTPININTCPKEILKSLKPDLKDRDVEKIIFARGNKGFRSQNELFAILESFKIPVQNVTIYSQYFWVEVNIITPSHRHIQSEYLFLRRLSKKEVPTIKLIQQLNLL